MIVRISNTCEYKFWKCITLWWVVHCCNCEGMQCIMLYNNLRDISHLLIAQLVERRTVTGTHQTSFGRWFESCSGDHFTLCHPGFRCQVSPSCLILPTHAFTAMLHTEGKSYLIFVLCTHLCSWTIENVRNVCTYIYQYQLTN